MKIRAFLLAGVISYALVGVSKVAPLEFSVAVDHPDHLYRCGELATFTVTVSGPAATGGVVRAALDNYGPKELGSAEWNLATSRVFTISGKLDEPGFLHLRLGGADAAKHWGVGYEPEKIVKASPSPTDFDAFWAAARARLAKEVPLDPVVVPIPEQSTAEYDAYRISFATFGRRVYGYLCVPKDKTKGPFPVEFTVNAAGFGNHTNKLYGYPDRILVKMSVYPFEPHWDWEKLGLKKKYDELNEACQKKYGCSYSTSGLAESRESYFFYPVLLGIDRVVDWVAARPDADKSRIWYTGTSQGGGFGFYLCGLNRNIKRATLFVPAITDTMGYLKGRSSGWPRVVEANSATPEKKAAAERNAPYFDGANFASRITCPVRVACGFADTTCPPPAVYASYNAIASKDKAIRHGFGMTHSCFGEIYEDLAHWLCGKTWGDEPFELGEGVELSGYANKSRAFYKPGEEITFQMCFTGLPPDAQLKKRWYVYWERRGDDHQEAKGFQEIKVGEYVNVKTKLDRPGFVWLRGYLTDAETNVVYRHDAKRHRRGKRLICDIGAGVEIDKLKSLPPPKDLAAFWAKRRAALDAVPVSVKRVEQACAVEGVKLWSVEVACAGKTPVVGYLSMPADASAAKRYPAMLKTHGYSPTPSAQRAPNLGENAKTTILLEINAHGFKLGEDEKYYKDAFAAIKSNGHDYAQDPVQNADPEKAYFGGMTWRVMRALDYLKTLPEWNGADLWADGVSQGGLQTIWAAALEPKLTKAFVRKPWCCEMSGRETQKRLLPVVLGLKEAPGLAYYDPVNLAAMIPSTCEVDIQEAGLGDYTCPPSGLAVFYNNLLCPKSICWTQGMTHSTKPHPAAKAPSFLFGKKPVTEATRVFQARIDAAAGSGARRLSVPAGDYEIGSVSLPSDFELHLEKGARLLGTRDWRDYSGGLVNAVNATNVAVTGEGTIDVRGQRPWFLQRVTPVRPHALRFENCVNVRIENVAVSNAASWTIILTRCDGVTVRGIDLFSHANHNNDGIDICGSRHVLVENSRIDSDDDGIVLKGWGADMTVEDVEVRNCTVGANCNFLKIGTETKGIFRNIRFHDCMIVPPTPSAVWNWSSVPGLVSPSNGISAIAVECVDGGQVEDVHFKNIEIRGGAQTAIFVRHGARRSVDGRKSHLKDVTIENVKGWTYSHIASSITGCAAVDHVRKGIRPNSIVIRNVDLTMPGGCETKDDATPIPEMPRSYPENRMFANRPLPAYGFYVRHADGVAFENVKVRTAKPDARPAYVEEDATGVVRKGCNF